MDTLASDIMSREVLTIQVGMTLEEALKVLFNHRVTGLPVVDEKGRMIGVLSEYDIISQLSSQMRGKKSLRVDSFLRPIRYSKKVSSVRETTTLKQVVKLFVQSKFRRLPVLDRKGRIVGIITRRDLMRVFYYRARLR